MDQLTKASITKKLVNINNMSNEELEHQIDMVDDLFVYMEAHPYNNTPQEKAKLDSIITKIYYAEMGRLNKDFFETIPLQLDAPLEPNTNGRYYNGSLIQINTRNFYNALQNPDFQSRMNCCQHMVKTISHEIQHHRQHILATSSYSSKKSLAFARDLAMTDLLDKKFYNDNYIYTTIENDANEVALDKLLKLRKYDKNVNHARLTHSLNKDLSLYSSDNVKLKSFEGKTYDLVAQDKEHLTDTVLDDIIVNHKQTDILNKYPVLQKIYNSNGTKKGTAQLIADMKDEQHELFQNKYLDSQTKHKAMADSEDMYLDLIYKSFEDLSPSELQNLGQIDLNMVLDKLENKFDREHKELLVKESQRHDVKDFLIKENPDLFSKLSYGLNNKITSMTLKTSINGKYKEQKKFIKGLRKGKIPKKLSNVQTQALQTMKPVNRMFNKFTNGCKNLGKKFVNFFKPDRSSLPPGRSTANNERTERLVPNTDDEITERLVPGDDNERTEKLVPDYSDENVTRLVPNKATHSTTKQYDKQAEANAFKESLKLKNWKQDNSTMPKNSTNMNQKTVKRAEQDNLEK